MSKRRSSEVMPELRPEAERRVDERDAGAHNGTASDESRRLLHELQVHQVELEMQNEELERVRAELESGLARYTELYDHAPVGYLSLDREGVIRAVNLTGARLFAAERADLAAQPLAPLVATSHGARLRAFLTEVFEGGTASCDVVTAHEGAAARDLRFTATVAAGGRECRAVVEDITERKATEERLRRAQKMEAIGQLAGGVAHDFNNLLAVILSYSTLLLEDMPEGDARRGDVLEIKKAGEHAATLTRQLLTFSRKQAFEAQRVDLNAVAQNLDRMLRRLVGERIELVLRLAPNLGMVSADPGQLEQIIMNLALNARDAMPDGGVLTIATADVDVDAAHPAGRGAVKAGHYVCVTVSDSGSGIDDATLAHLFEPFFTTKERGHGTGLGLAAVFSIVERGGGGIAVASALGEGTSVEVYLPRLPAPSATSRPPTRADPDRGTETILVVEDEDAVRKLVERILCGAGYTVLAAASGAEALPICEQHHDEIALLLTDVVMPHMSGVELSERIAARFGGIKVLYMSGYTAGEIPAPRVLGTATELIGKPFSPSELTRRVRDVLDGTRRG